MESFIDFEVLTIKQISISVRAFSADGLRFADATMTVSINDVNDNPPEFTQRVSIVYRRLWMQKSIYAYFMLSIKHKFPSGTLCSDIIINCQLLEPVRYNVLAIKMCILLQIPLN